MSDPYEDEKHYREGWVAGSQGRPKSSNPYTGKPNAETFWNLGWERGASGGEYDGYA